METRGQNPNVHSDPNLNDESSSNTKDSSNGNNINPEMMQNLLKMFANSSNSSSQSKKDENDRKYTVEPIHLLILILF